jgi:hypothetical protein
MMIRTGNRISGNHKGGTPGIRVGSGNLYGAALPIVIPVSRLLAGAYVKSQEIQNPLFRFLLPNLTHLLLPL